MRKAGLFIDTIASGTAEHTSRCAVTLGRVICDSRWSANARVQCAVADERRLTMCKFDLGMSRTRSLDLEHDRSDIPPFDEQGF